MSATSLVRIAATSTFTETVNRVVPFIGSPPGHAGAAHWVASMRLALRISRRSRVYRPTFAWCTRFGWPRAAPGGCVLDSLQRIPGHGLRRLGPGSRSA